LTFLGQPKKFQLVPLINFYVRGFLVLISIRLSKTVPYSALNLEHIYFTPQKGNVNPVRSRTRTMRPRLLTGPMSIWACIYPF